MPSIARIQLAVAAILVPGALALAQPALATDYCVAPNDTCGGVKLQDFQAALNAAAVDTAPDRIFLGAKTYLAPAQGFVYDPLPAGPVEIAGAGRDQTKLTGTAGAYRTAVFGGQATSVHDLSIVMPPNAPAGAQALRTNGVVKNVSVADGATELNVVRTGVVFTGPGRLEDSDVFVSQTHPATGVVLASGATVRNSNVFASTGISSNGGTIDRAVIDGDAAGVDVHHGATKVTSTVINTYGYGSVGIAGESTDGDSSLDVDGATIIGPFYPGSGTGINAGNVYAPTAKVDVVVTNS